MMLNFMRVHMGRKILWILVAGISLTFVFFGVFPEMQSGGGLLGGSEVASVNGEKISLQEFQQAVNRDVENYRNLGMDLPPELMENIKFGTLQGLVKNKLMLVEARRLGITASDREVSDEIQNMPYFLDQNKKFDVTLYRNVLAANHLSPGQFEQNVREGLINQRMMDFIKARIRVTPVEVEREYQLANEQRNLEFVRFAREDAYKKMKVDPQEVDAFLADKDKSLQINTFYTQNNSRYNKPEQVCARHLLTMDKDPEAKKAAAPPKAFASLKPTPANFAALAGKSSEDPGSKAKGGDLGCFGKGMMDKAFEETAFKTPVGQVSAPVHSTFGWHYIYVYKKEPAVHKEFESVKREIAEEILKKQRLDEVRKLNLAAGEAAVKSWPPKGEKVLTTGFFNSLEGNIPQIGRADEIIKAAFDPKAKIQTGPQLFESAGGVIVARVKERRSADMAKLKDQASLQESSLRERKLRAFMPAWLEDVQKRVKISYNKKLL